MGKNDIEYLKVKMYIYVIKEEYEKAEQMKKWIIELGGDPTFNSFGDIKLKNPHQK
jgi:hypothetical protein